MNALERTLIFCARYSPAGIRTLQDERITKALELLSGKIEREWGIAGLAKECGISESRFTHLFNQITGTPPREYIENLRLQQAREYLETSPMSIGQTADAVGFGSQSYFTRRFVKSIGCTPYEYRRKYRARQENGR